MFKKYVYSFLTALVVILAAPANATTVTFNEASAPSGQLDGTSFYQTYGIANFSNAVRFGSDPRLLADGYGITNSPAAVATVYFVSQVSDLTFNWASYTTGIQFSAQIYDSSNLLLATFESSADVTYGSFLFDLSGIDHFSFSSTGGSSGAAIDTLTFNNVPEPGVLPLLCLGLVALVAVRRRKS